MTDPFEPLLARLPQVDNGGGRADWVRLPERTEKYLFDYALQANRTRVKRDECREWALGWQAQREAGERMQNETGGH
ncbi:hypothetical protein [Nitrosospira sp. Is2]|uniref:hypothetical protein n=1 Tax=Nitrosospira sp. Is2 TaxID=3080532 RepID=UPI0029530CF6|nr:hypothetical protein [Nitrosospira sp. Is2]WON74160.1 hypothetical protein R5L00_01330 [Nitrosospira sp. Is2]